MQSSSLEMSAGYGRVWRGVACSFGGFSPMLTKLYFTAHRALQATPLQRLCPGCSASGPLTPKSLIFTLFQDRPKYNPLISDLYLSALQLIVLILDFLELDT